MKKLLLLPILLFSFAQAETIQCRVTEVISGEAFNCLTNSRDKIQVKLFQIDTPKLDQPYGQKAKLALSDMIYGRNVYLYENLTLSECFTKLNTTGVQVKVADVELSPRKEITTTPTNSAPDSLDDWIYDPNGNLNRPTSINYMLVEQGYAWYTSYYRRCGYPLPEIGEKAEKEAREAKRGLWADPDPIPPWEWRKNKK